MYWEPEFENMDREELEQLQLERLEATLNRVYMNVPFYQDVRHERRNSLRENLLG